MSVLGDRLKKARERKGYSQVAVFERIKINNKTLSRYENGGTEPDINTLNKLAELYEVSVDYLFGRTDSSLGITERISNLTPEEEELKKKFLSRMNEILEEKSGLDPAKLDVVLKIMESGFLEDLEAERKGVKSRTKLED